MLLNRIKNQELIEFIREDDVTHFEGKIGIGEIGEEYISRKKKDINWKAKRKRKLLEPEHPRQKHLKLEPNFLES